MKRHLLSYLGLCIIGISFLALTLSPPNPPGVVGPYLNGVFPKGTPGSIGSWELAEPFPWIDIPAPLRIVPYGNDHFMILCKQGEVYMVSKNGDPSRLILDIKDKTFKLSDAGAVGFVLHPRFGDSSYPEKQEAFVYYRTKPDVDVYSDNGNNVLSKFKWDADTESFDESSEEILIQQYDRTPWHDGGGMFFDDEGYLYLSIGDEGYEHYQSVSTQRIDGGFFSGVFRIDIDNDPTRSHPIRRQPKSNATPAESWGNTFSQGYSIPNDNPWLAEDGSILEEYYALGLRSPYSLHPDPITDEIWVADVGSDKKEEISVFTKGDNLQWPYIEGTTVSTVHEKPEDLIGNEKGIVYEYTRDIGSAIIGAGVYNSNLHPYLLDKYIFGDYTANKVMAIHRNNATNEDTLDVIIPNIYGSGVDLLPETNLSGIHIMENGKIYITAIGKEIGSRGYILELISKETFPDPPIKLSELGVFLDMETLEVTQDLLPYDVNSPLWSDGATKQRWIALPNDGEFNAKEERIQFDAIDPWEFPSGTVIVKQFNLPIDLSNPELVTKLETRFFVIGEDGKGYGLTYKWNEEGTEAYLLGSGDSRDIDIYDNGNYSHTQVWDFPSRDQCINCHNSETNNILGVNTQQMNRLHNYNGQSVNQLDYFNEWGMFSTDIISSQIYPKSYHLTDNDVPLEVRIRSYMDSNCASCHRSTYVAEVDLDLRFHKTLNLKKDLSTPTQSHASDPSRQIIKPGNHQLSELWLRDASNGENKMPPIGRRLVDQMYVDSLAKWIDLLEKDVEPKLELIVFPNPTEGWLSISIPEDMTPPYQMGIYSISGQSVYRETTEDLSNYINLSHLPAGTYVLMVEDGNRKEIKKIIIY